MSEKEKTPQEEEFQDPLEDYEPKEYTDPLERVLAEERVETITSTPFLTVSADTSVQEGLEALVDLDVACLMVEKEGRLVGIFSEWDVLHRVAGAFEDLESVRMEEVMTTEPLYVHDRDTVATALAVVSLGGCRHVPVLDVNDRIVGIVSPHRLVSYLEDVMAKT